jgi:tetratricopeptide (TPR) repeat protein
MAQSAKEAKVPTTSAFLDLLREGTDHRYRGDAEAARQAFEIALHLPESTPAERARCLVALSTVQVDLGDWQEAERLAREAATLAESIGDREQLAHAKLGFSLLLMSAHEAGHAVATPEPLARATTMLEEAATLFATIDGPASVEQFSCMLNQGELIDMQGGDPRELYQRITTELGGAKWQVNAARGGPFASHVNYLRGRGSLEQALWLTKRQNASDAKKHFLEARAFFQHSQSADVPELQALIDQHVAPAI